MTNRLCNPMLAKFIVQSDETAVDWTILPRREQPRPVAAQDEPDQARLSGICIRNGRLRPAGRMGVIMAQHGRSISPCGAMRLQKHGWIQLELAGAIRGDIGGGKDGFDPIGPSQQEAANLFGGVLGRMRQDLIERGP